MKHFIDVNYASVGDGVVFVESDAVADMLVSFLGGEIIEKAWVHLKHIHLTRRFIKVRVPNLRDAYRYMRDVIIVEREVIDHGLR